MTFRASNSTSPASNSWWRQTAATAGPLLALLAVYLMFAALEAALSDRPAVFLTAENLQLIAANSAVIAICALGMTVVIASGGIDLSVGSGVALCATVLACGLKLNWNPWLALAATLFTGCALGALNGALISSLRVVPFIVTLGTMTIFLGAGKMLADKVDQGGQTVRPVVKAPEDKDFEKNQIPLWMQTFTSTRATAVWPPWFTAAAGKDDATSRAAWDQSLDWIRFPVGIWCGVLLAGVLAAAMHYTVFGRYVLALGSNEATARLCGINVPLTRIAVYTLCGLFVALAGVYQFSRLKSGNPTSGVGLELRVIAAVVIGGGSLSGGRASVLGTIAGAVLMVTIASGGTQLGVPNPLQDVILGAIIIAAVTLDQLRHRRFHAG